MKSKSLTKRQFTMAVLVLALALAVYLNWRFAENDIQNIVAASSSDTSVTEDITDKETVKNYGDAQYVAKITDDVQRNEYFASAKLERQEARDGAVDLIQKSLQQTELSREARDSLAMQLTELTEQIKLEGDIETVVKAKGFTECLVTLSSDSARVLVSSPAEGLNDTGVSQIAEAVVSACGLPVSRVSIVEVK